LQNLLAIVAAKDRNAIDALQRSICNRRTSLTRSPSD